VEGRNPDQQKPFCILPSAFCLGSGFRLGFAQAGNAVALFPLTAFLEQFRAFETLENVPFTAQFGRRAQTPML
jgi:hypothetical protein